ncbi:MAG: MOSC domain-containing protein [Herminiimonas sp.]|nr:MOSC domain-containing protein [Herminiimonas sp.]
MKIISINIGTVANLFDPVPGQSAGIKTGIHKHPVAGAVAVGRMGLHGDEQADLSLHGGLDKAVYAYPVEHYAFWDAQRQASSKRAVADVALTSGAMGENLTLEGLLETEVWIGDRLLIGAVTLQVSEPRNPCFKFNARMGINRASKLMVQSGFSGFYLRVVETGSLRAGDAITLVPGAREVALASLHEQRRKGRQYDLF